MTDKPVEPFTDTEKMDEATREVAMRIRHYPALIAKGTMSASVAQRRTKIMQAIADDYRQRVAAAVPQLDLSQ